MMLTLRIGSGWAIDRDLIDVFFFNVSDEKVDVLCVILDRFLRKILDFRSSHRFFFPPKSGVNFAETIYFCGCPNPRYSEHMKKKKPRSLSKSGLLVREAGLEVHVPRLAASILSFYG